MTSAVAVSVLPSSTEPLLKSSSSSSSSSSSLLTESSDSITVTNLLATATTLAATGQSFKCTEGLIAQKQHQLAYIKQQQRLQQEKQRQLIYSQQQRHQQYLRCSGQLSFTTPGGLYACSGKNKGKEPRVVDLVDDVWRLVFFILACDCKDLGRAMQVSRRFHNLIANDALLWRLTYKLTISGSIFAGQKPLLSPSWIREHQLSGQEASWALFSSSSAYHGRSGSTSNGVLPYILEKASSYMNDRNADGLDSMPRNTDEHGPRRESIGNAGVASSSALSALASSRPHPGSQSTGALL